MTGWNEIPWLFKAGIVLAVLAVLSLVFFFFEVMPLQQEAQQNQTTLRAKQAEIAQLQPYATKLNDLNRQVEGMKAKIEEQKKYLPDQKEVPDFITAMQQEAARSGVEIRRYTPRAVVAQNYYTEAPFEIDVDGGYYKMLNFFERVSQMERIVNITGLSIAAIKAGGSRVRRTYPYGPDETVVVNCVATTFYASAAVKQPPAPKKKK